MPPLRAKDSGDPTCSGMQVLFMYVQRTGVNDLADDEVGEAKQMRGNFFVIALAEGESSRVGGRESHVKQPEVVMREQLRRFAPTSMAELKRKRHKANREAALRVEAGIQGARAGAPSQAASSSRAHAQASSEQNRRFALVPLADAPKTKRKAGEPKLPPELRNNVVLEVGNRQKFVQRRDLPPSAVPGVSAADAFFKARRPEEHGRGTLPTELMHVMSPGPAIGADSDDDFIVVTQQVPAQSRHHRRRVRQHSKWRDSVIPSLVNRYLAQKYGAGLETVESEGGCRCGRQTSLSVTFIDWDGTCWQTRAQSLC